MENASKKDPVDSFDDAAGKEQEDAKAYHVEDEDILSLDGSIQEDEKTKNPASLDTVSNIDNNDLKKENGVSFENNTDEEKSEKRQKFFVIQEYPVKKDFTNGEQPLIRNSTIEELKLKLENKEFLVKQRPNTPTSPLTPNTPTTPTRHELSEDDSEDMIPETRAPPLLTDDGLIAPRKPINPVREDPGRQNLHRELLFNQKIGKNVLNQKSELQRALERHKDNVAKKQLENHIAAKTPELEKVIADRARRLENPVKEVNEDDKVINKEFLQARMKLKSTNEIK